MDIDTPTPISLLCAVGFKKRTNIVKYNRYNLDRIKYFFTAVRPFF